MWNIARINWFEYSVNGIQFTSFGDGISDAQELVWRDVNQVIRSHAIAGVDRVFDIAEILSQAAPRDNLLIPEYMSSEFDAHPKGKAGTAVASAFLGAFTKWNE